MENHKSYCPINLALETFGDKWTLLIIRDIMMDGKRHFREILQSDEKISTNILSSRLNKLEENGIITKENDPTHKQKVIYSLTKKGIDLFPVVMAIAEWSIKHEPVGKKQSEHAQSILSGGKSLEKKMISDLKKAHLS